MADLGRKYSSMVGFVYIFNLIVGAGTLTLPKAVSGAGVLIAAVVFVVLAFLSFLTSTFMVEAMAIANALISEDTTTAEHENESPLLGEDRHLINEGGSLNADRSFMLKTKVEMGEMAHLFFNKIGIRLFYLCIAIYLYGDLAIYATAVPKSLENLVCGSHGSKSNESSNNIQTWEMSNGYSINERRSNETSNRKCWGMDDLAVYRIFVAIFAVLVCPFAFTNIQKTKYIQYLTTVLRWLSFAMMIVICLIRIGQKKSNGRPSFANFSGFPDLFGASVYSFMCQHSLPSLITPMKNKNHVTKVLALDILFALLFYSFLSFSAIFTFESSEIRDVYTLSFREITVESVSTFLALYPVFALSTNFPIISITLRENLKSLFRKDDVEFQWSVENIIFPLFATVPPIVIALSTQNVEMLVSITGSYAGVGVQYIIPTMLVYCGRRKVLNVLGYSENGYGSPFKHGFWVLTILAWTFVCVVVVTVYNIKKRL